MIAPERIWADPTPNDHFNPAIYDWDFGTWSEDGFSAGASVQYVRADLHDTLRAERDALAERVERLEGALREVEGSRYKMKGDAHAQCILIARAALSTAQSGE
jgi:hypothetical protein